MSARDTRWTIEGRGARFAVRAWHPDRDVRRAVFVVHGLAEHSGRYQHVAEGFVARGWSVVAADLRGHGLTTGKRGHASSIDQLIDDVHFVIVDATNRFDTHEWLLYGHSMGGAIALASALQFPDSIRACIATGPAIRPGFTPPAWKVAFGKAIRHLVPSLTMNNGIDVNGLSRRPEIVAAFLADPLVHDRVSAALGVGLLEVGATLMAQASTLRVPTLIVHGADDPITSSVASSQFAQRARESCDHRLVPGAFHEVHNEASWPATWLAMTQWIDSHC